MKTIPRLPRQRALSWVTAATLAFTLTACGSSDDESDQDTPSQSSQASSNDSNGDEIGSGSTGAEGGADLPDGFPDGVPLPDHDRISSGSQLSETTWRLLLVVDPDDDAAAESYAAALTETGFEVKTSDVIVSANSPTLNIEAVVRPPAITLQVMKRSE